MFIRSILEQSCVLWHSSLSLEDSHDLERVQKSAVKIILKEDYKDYETSLIQVNFQTLCERRKYLCENFATETANHEDFHTMFPKNDVVHPQETRNPENYKVNMHTQKETRTLQFLLCKDC